MSQIEFVEEQVGGQWMITSPAIPGLFVVHNDLELARADVWTAVRAMDRARVRIADRMAVEHRVAAYA